MAKVIVPGTGADRYLCHRLVDVTGSTNVFPLFSHISSFIETMDRPLDERERFVSEKTGKFRDDTLQDNKVARRGDNVRSNEATTAISLPINGFDYWNSRARFEVSHNRGCCSRRETRREKTRA